MNWVIDDRFDIEVTGRLIDANSGVAQVCFTAVVTGERDVIINYHQ